MIDPWVRRCAGFDLAMVRDATALVILEWDRYVDRYTLVFDLEFRPGKVPLRPVQTIFDMFAIAEAENVSTVCSDVHYFPLLSEHLPEDMDLIKFPSDPNKKATAYRDFKIELGEGTIDLSRATDPLIKQLIDTKGKPTTGGGMSIGHDRKKGSHGDSVSALIAAYYGMERGEMPEKTRKLSAPRRFRR